MFTHFGFVCLRGFAPNLLRLSLALSEVNLLLQLLLDESLQLIDSLLLTLLTASSIHDGAPLLACTLQKPSLHQYQLHVLSCIETASLHMYEAGQHSQHLISSAS